MGSVGRVPAQQFCDSMKILDPTVSPLGRMSHNPALKSQEEPRTSLEWTFTSHQLKNSTSIPASQPGTDRQDWPLLYHSRGSFQVVCAVVFEHIPHLNGAVTATWEEKNIRE